MQPQNVQMAAGETGQGRWMRVARPVDRRLRPLFARPPLGFAEHTATPGRWLMTPGPTVTIIVNLAEPFGGLPRAFVGGIEQAHSVVRHDGRTCCLDLKLTPPGAFRLLGVPMHEIAGRVVDVTDLLGPGARRLTEALVEAPGEPATAEGTPPGTATAAAWNRRFDLLEEFLLRHAATGPEPSAPVEWAWRRMLESGGRTPIGALADEIGWSDRHLIAKFRQQIGLPPKTAARVIRFARLLQLLDGAEGAAEARWDRLAVTCGYYDQAHLNRDFREFAGTTPTDYVTRRVPSGNVVADDAVPARRNPRRPATTPAATR